MKIDEQIRILKELKASAGWAMLRSYMENAILQAAMDMAEGKPMPEAQYQFTRGAMWAAKRHLSLPDQLLSKLETELLLTTDPATAGKHAHKVSLRPDKQKEGI